MRSSCYFYVLVCLCRCFLFVVVFVFDCCCLLLLLFVMCVLFAFCCFIIVDGLLLLLFCVCLCEGVLFVCDVVFVFYCFPSPPFAVVVWLAGFLIAVVILGFNMFQFSLFSMIKSCYCVVAPPFFSVFLCVCLFFLLLLKCLFAVFG